MSTKISAFKSNFSFHRYHDIYRNFCDFNRNVLFHRNLCFSRKFLFITELSLNTPTLFNVRYYSRKFPWLFLRCLSPHRRRDGPSCCVRCTLSRIRPHPAGWRSPWCRYPRRSSAFETPEHDDSHQKNDNACSISSIDNNMF